MKNSFPEWWDKGLEDWSVDKMFEKLNSLGIKIDKEKFLALTDKYSSAQKLADSELYPQICFPKGDREEDFVWMAAEELWKKLRKDKESLEMISEKIEKPFEEAEKLVWERYPNRILQLEQQGFDILINYCFSGNDRPQRPLPLWQRQEIQEVLWEIGGNIMRKLKVDMSELEFAFEDVSCESSHYLDKETGEILLIMDDLGDEDSEELSKKVEANPDRYIEITKAQGSEGYEDMSDFADSVEDHNLQEKLAIALNGKGAFRRFKDVLLDYTKEKEAWFEFKSKRLRQHIKEWLEDEDLEVQDGE